MFVALSPVAVGCFFPSSSSDTTAHSDPCLPPSNPTVFFLSLSFLLPFLRAKTRSPTTSYPFLFPELALMPRYLPLLLILRTTRHLTTQTSVSLFPFSCTYILSLSLASSLFLLVLRASISLASTHVSFMIPLPPATSVCLPRAFTSRNARSSLRRAYYTDGVYAEYYARSDSLMRRCRMNVPSCDSTVNHFVKLLYREFLAISFPPRNSD